jgi:hypothetical protein
VSERTPPVEGEHVLFCEHCNVGPEFVNLFGRHHWYWVGLTEDGKPQMARRDDGQWFEVRWICLCPACHEANYKAAGRMVEEVKAGNPIRYVKQHAEWRGASPDIQLIT